MFLSILLVCFVFLLKTYAAPPSIFYVANKDTCLYRNHGGDYIGDIQKGRKLQYYCQEKIAVLLACVRHENRARCCAFQTSFVLAPMGVEPISPP